MGKPALGIGDGGRLDKAEKASAEGTNNSDRVDAVTYASLDDFLSRGKADLAPGPVALLFMEDGVEIDSTIRHHQKIGFRNILVLGPDALTMATDLVQVAQHIAVDLFPTDAVPAAVNQLIEALPGRWIYYAFNGEYLFFPFCETRTIGEMLAFHTEERRDAMLTYVIDLYASDLGLHPNGVSRDSAHLDKSGYYAAARLGGEHDHPLERQLDFFGGIRWRFEELIPAEKRRIDRIGIFRAKPGLQLLADHTFNDPEYNTYACPWHNNLTAAIGSFRTAKALRTNPGSSDSINSFVWHNSQKFEWHSQQLMDLGLMEPGQWF